MHGSSWVSCGARRMCVAVCCSVVCCSVLQCVAVGLLRYCVCCSLLQCVVACCSVLQCVSVCSNGSSQIQCCAWLMCLPLSCSLLQCVVPSRHAAAHYCNTMQYTSTSTLQHTVAHCNTLQHSATHCNTLEHTLSKKEPCQSMAHAQKGPCTSSPLQHIIVHCNTLYRTAIQFNTLQHTATTHCSTNNHKRFLPTQGSNAKRQCVAACCSVVDHFVHCLFGAPLFV